MNLYKSLLVNSLFRNSHPVPSVHLTIKRHPNGVPVLRDTSRIFTAHNE